MYVCGPRLSRPVRPVRPRPFRPSPPSRPSTSVQSVHVRPSRPSTEKVKKYGRTEPSIGFLPYARFIPTPLGYTLQETKLLCLRDLFVLLRIAQIIEPFLLLRLGVVGVRVHPPMSTSALFASLSLFLRCTRCCRRRCLEKGTIRAPHRPRSTSDAPDGVAYPQCRRHRASALADIPLLVFVRIVAHAVQQLVQASNRLYVVVAEDFITGRRGSKQARVELCIRG